eukprot:1384322-Amorphochlora_amoeboformis.AAC.1
MPKFTTGGINTQTDLARAMFLGQTGPPTTEQEKEHKFWNTQPVPQKERPENVHGEIEQKVVKDIRAIPLKLPSAFEWTNCNMADSKTVDEVYNLLSSNYVEDDESTFRFDYSREALCPPGYKEEFHVGVRVVKSKKLVGFITGIPARVHVFDGVKNMVEINFLCVHKKLRSKRLAPVLIREITRRVNRTKFASDVWQAVYTAGVVLPRPVSRNRYYHRSLNPKKLIGIGFSRLQPLMTMARTIKLYRVLDTPQTPGIRAYKPASDTKQCQKLLMNYLKNFKLYQEFDAAEFKHWFTSRKDVVSTFVVEDPKTRKITDFLSFYSLPSSILNHEKYKKLNAAYSFYNVSTKTPWKQLMSDALILANK